jgi:hypothetical protein
VKTPAWPLPLLGVAWVLVPPYLGFGAVIMSASFFGDEPDAAQRTQATLLLWGAVTTAVVLPLAGLLLARRLRRRGAVGFFATALTIGTLIALLTGGARLWTWAEQQPAPTSGVTGGCQEHSGGDNRCPGG